MKPTVILRNNRWRCDHGWDIDLDDGSTNYHIYNNLTLNGGIKLREGFLPDRREQHDGEQFVSPARLVRATARTSFATTSSSDLYRPIRVRQAVGQGDATITCGTSPGMEGAKPARNCCSSRAAVTRALGRSRCLVCEPVHGRLPGAGRLSGAASSAFRTFPWTSSGCSGPN